jgi:RND family efflux transporter MFP subunit
VRLRTVFKIVLPVLVLIGAIGIAGVLQATKPELAPAPPEERSWLVSAVSASVGTVQPEIVAFGEIVALRDAELRAPVAGKILATSATFVDGGRVKAGELLVTVDPFDYELALGETKAALAEAKAHLAELEAQIAAETTGLKQNDAQLALAERELERRKKLKEGGVGTDKSIDDIRMQWSEREEARTLRRDTLKTWRARADQTRAAIDRNELLVKRAQRDLEDTKIVAPFDGLLSETSGSVGKELILSDRLARLVDLGTLEARVHLSDSVFGRLVADGATLEGKPATVIWRSGDAETRFAAQLARADGRIDPKTGGVELFARLAPIDGDTPLRPGAFVEIRLPDRAYDGAAQLPEAALYDERTIYAVEAGRLVARAVTLLARIGNDVVVRGALKTGDMIVTSRFAEIGPGAKVTTR